MCAGRVGRADFLVLRARRNGGRSQSGLKRKAHKISVDEVCIYTGAAKK